LRAKRKSKPGKGKTIAMAVPVDEMVTLMLEAGAEVKILGRVQWRDEITGEPADEEARAVCPDHFATGGTNMTDGRFPDRGFKDSGPEEGKATTEVDWGGPVYLNAPFIRSRWFCRSVNVASTPANNPHCTLGAISGPHECGSMSRLTTPTCCVANWSTRRTVPILMGTPSRPARRVLCAGHVQQPGGESPLCNLMEVKHD
jgi:hypothetical protein